MDNDRTLAETFSERDDWTAVATFNPTDWMMLSDCLGVWSDLVMHTLKAHPTVHTPNGGIMCTKVIRNFAEGFVLLVRTQESLDRLLRQHVEPPAEQVDLDPLGMAVSNG